MEGRLVGDGGGGGGGTKTEDEMGYKYQEMGSDSDLLFIVLALNYRIECVDGGHFGGVKQ